MSFKNPKIKSSYQKAAMGKVLYDAIVETNAKKIVDFGILNGYSTVCMALAARETGGKVYAYDLFEEYEYKGSSKDVVMRNLEKHNVSDIVVLEKKCFNEWLDEQEDFDILHVDVSNTGDTIELLHQSLSSRDEKVDGRVFFEGGSTERDAQDWMIKYKKRKITSLLKTINYRVMSSHTYNEDGRIISPAISELFLGKDDYL